MREKRRRYTIQGFLSEFLQRDKFTSERPFCWVLGSGASAQSRIPTGSTLANQWLRELYERENTDGLPIEQWATAENLDIPEFDSTRAESFYPWIYWRRFHDYPEQGYAFLEAAMDHAEPSIGYSFLAQIMGNTRHQAAVTTNFDNLVADALFIYAHKTPLVCGHESLTSFILPKLRRPLVAKIHRDLLLNPKNNPKEIAELPGEWKTALKRIFDNFTPIVIGYGGNDGSLMNFLGEMEPIKGGIFWCYRNEKNLSPKIHEVVERHSGKLVQIAGFDEVMLQLWNKLGLPSPLPALQKTQKLRETAFMDQFSALQAKLQIKGSDSATEKTLEPARKAAQEASDRMTKEKDWWAWELKARAESDPVKQEAIYREGMEDFPNSAELIGNFAVFMKNDRENSDEAERLYRKALELDPNNAINTGNYANFMMTIRKNYDEAERLFRKALELDPNNATNTGNYANFMMTIRKNYDEAERLYRKANELDSKDERLRKNYEIFRKKHRS